MKTTTPATQPAEFVRRAPATSYALRAFAERPAMPQPTRLVLLTTAVLADRDLYSGDGYRQADVREIAEMTGKPVHLVNLAMKVLLRLRLLEPTTGPLGEFYRIPQSAFDYSNEV